MPAPLPLYLTDVVRERLWSDRDPGLARFLDVFHHRLLSLFYRAWADGRKAVDFDRPEVSHFRGFFGSFFGLGSAGMRDRDAVPDTAKLFFTGRLTAPQRNAEGLEAILADYFGLPARIVAFVGQWLRLPAESVCALGGSRASGSLGRNLVVGKRVWVGDQKFRVRFGPLRFSQFAGLLPRTQAFRELRDWLRHYLGRELSAEVQPVLLANEIPATRLGRRSGAGQLGWTTWLKSRPAKRDAEQLILQVDRTSYD